MTPCQDVEPVPRGVRLCASDTHEDDYEAWECAAGNPRYRCAAERQARFEMVLWLAILPLTIFLGTVMVAGLVILREVVQPWLRGLL